MKPTSTLLKNRAAEWSLQKRLAEQIISWAEVSLRDRERATHQLSPALFSTLEGRANFRLSQGILAGISTAEAEHHPSPRSLQSRSFLQEKLRHVQTGTRAVTGQGRGGKKISCVLIHSPASNCTKIGSSCTALAPLKSN